MKTTALNLVLLDDNTIMAGPLSNYLNKKFGTRVNISTFSDADKCIQNIDERSHVIILDYLLNGKENGVKNGLENFNSIKKLNPKVEVTMITSDGDVAMVAKEMQRGASNYIIKRERYLHDILRLLDRVVLSPIKTIVTYPVRRMTYYFSVNDYLMMFLVAFISVGLLVFVGYLSAEFFR